MKDSYSRLIEDLPAREAPQRGQVASARAMRDFVEHLPLANPAQAARDVAAMLDSMEATRWPVGERIEALEALRAPVAGLCEGIEQQLGVESHPLPPAKEKLVETARGFHRGLARNYALALHELCGDGKLPMFKGKAAATAALDEIHAPRPVCLRHFPRHRRGGDRIPANLEFGAPDPALAALGLG